jgi:NAD(P)-dependent dehydrogenase (short-subunit alcohol dehydrogenase family)
MRYLITGAASGIGLAIAELASSGNEPNSLVLVDRSDAVESIAATLEKSGSEVVPVVADLYDPDAPATIVSTAIAALGGIDAIFSNAGMMASSPLEELSVEAYERTFAVNTRATWLLAKAAFPALKASCGSITATASISATHPTPPAGAYSASKAALRMLVQQLAVEWGKFGIRANCVSPGPTDTGLTQNSFGGNSSSRAAQNRAYREALIPLRRIGSPEDVAAAALFLASPAARQITGVDLAVDGGLSLTVMPVTGRVPGFSLDEITAKEAVS